ncbi:hypothetical protein C7999DRAFT_18113, partial [Corynascus novoguineensis]
MGSQPECCPFTPATTSTGVYPRPGDAKDAVVKKCPSDYYAIFGSCCPNAFTPWTVALGGATPCYSTLRATTALPSTTRDAVIKPRAAIPTVTVTNTVFAMQYAVTADEDYVSPGGVAGAIVGGAVLAGMLLWVYMAFTERYRQRQTIAQLRSELGDIGDHMPGTSEVPISPCASPRQFRDATQADTEKRLVLYQDFPNSDSKIPAPEYAEFSASRTYPPKSNARLTLATANKPTERCDRTLVRPHQTSRGKVKLPHPPNRTALQILETAFTRNTLSSSSSLKAPDAEPHRHEPISTRAHPPPVPGLLHLPRSDVPSRSHPTAVNLLSADGSGNKRPSDPQNSRQRPRPIVQKPLGFSLDPSLLASAE